MRCSFFKHGGICHFVTWAKQSGKAKLFCSFCLKRKHDIVQFNVSLVIWTGKKKCFVVEYLFCTPSCRVSLCWHNQTGINGILWNPPQNSKKMDFEGNNSEWTYFLFGVTLVLWFNWCWHVAGGRCFCSSTDGKEDSGELDFSTLLKKRWVLLCNIYQGLKTYGMTRILSLINSFVHNSLSFSFILDRLPSPESKL